MNEKALEGAICEYQQTLMLILEKSNVDTWTRGQGLLGFQVQEVHLYCDVAKMDMTQRTETVQTAAHFHGHKMRMM